MCFLVLTAIDIVKLVLSNLAYDFRVDLNPLQTH